ncbi:MAG TPA: peptide ABC transporter ATP-binding protein, partial [Clostridiales bacterium]|nr:peptide ABC transporter ATP-binding protein [Clostridiales bacterium]
MSWVVEHAETAELFANPVHPYAKALLHAVPTVGLSRRNGEGFLLRG